MPSSEAKQIIEYCKKGSTEQLIEALAQTSDTDIIDNRDNSLLSIALYRGHWQTFSALIDEGYHFNPIKPLIISACQYKKDQPKGIELVLDFDPDTNKKNSNQRTALMTASLLGHTKKVKFLLNQGAKVDLQDDQGNTALMDAIQSHNKKIVELLLPHQAKIDQSNHLKETALIIAVKQKSPSEDIIKLLLEAGANPEFNDHRQRSAWLIAKQKHVKIARIIETHLNTINQIELPFFNSEEKKPSKNHKAEDEEKKENIQSEEIRPDNDTNTQAEKAPQQDQLNSEQKSPYTKTTEEDVQEHLISEEDTTEAHIEEDGDTNAAEPTPSEPQQKNQKPKDEKLVTIMDAEIKVIQTPTAQPQHHINTQEWFHAAKTGNLGGLNRMILAGIDINSIDDKGCTALIRASGHSKRAVVSFLLQQKADIELRSHNGSTALSSSILGNCHRVTGLLLEKGANPNGLGPADYHYATIATAQWNDGMLSILHRHGADIYIENNKQQNLLHIAALAIEHSHKTNHAKATFQFFLDHGIDVNSQDHEGHTPLMLLCGLHQKKYQANDRETAAIVHHLIKLGAAAAMTNHAGKSALDAAKYHKMLHTKGVLMNALSWSND